MPFDEPFLLGPFRVNMDGRLALAQPDSLPRFHLSWRGCRVEAHLMPGGEGQGLLEFEAAMGRVPSTAEPQPPREAVFAALRDLPTDLPEGWRLRLRADHRVAMGAMRPLPLPSTIAELVSEVTMFLLELGPYLDLLTEVGVEAVGNANICPG